MSGSPLPNLNLTDMFRADPTVIGAPQQAFTGAFSVGGQASQPSMGPLDTKTLLLIAGAGIILFILMRRRKK